MAYRQNDSSSSLSILGPDGKLSAAGAAASLKYAKPHELPSHPSVGIPTGANGASSANRAASLAANGSALDMWRYKGTDTGHSAASLAMKAPSIEAYKGVDEDGRKKALLAATLSVNRRNEKKTPAGTPPLRSGKAVQATRIKRLDQLHMPAEMFTEHPPIEAELEVQRYQDALHASAVSMAKQLYKLEQNKNASPTPSGRTAYPGLQEAAQALAAERLAKLDPDGIQAYKEHYGYGVSLGRSQILDDQDRAEKIRGQMGRFSAMLANVDEDKRKTDRESLMALAEKRVRDRMAAIDEQVLLDTGKVSHTVSPEWEAEARAKAAQNAEERQLTGKVHIGGKKFVDMSEVEAVAAARMQPVLDDMTAVAQARRERDEEIRIAEEERRKKLAEEKAAQIAERDELRMQQYQEKNEMRQKMAEEKAERDQIRAEEAAERKRIKEEERARLFQEKNERNAQEAAERSERQRVEAEEKAERRKVEGEARLERQKVEAEQKAERQKVAAEQKAERKKLEAERREERLRIESEQRTKRLEENAARQKVKAEDRAKFERIKREEMADRERERAEQRAERERVRAAERESQLQRIADLKERQVERDRLMEEEEQIEAADAQEELDIEAAEEEELAEELGEPVAALTTTDEPALESDTATQIKVPLEDDVARSGQTEGGLYGAESALDIANRVITAPVDHTAEADQTLMSRGIETEEGVKPIEEGVIVEDPAAVEAQALADTTGTTGTTGVTGTTGTTTTTTADTIDPVETTTVGTTAAPAGPQRRESRRKSFFSRIKESINRPRGAEFLSANRKSTTKVPATAGTGTVTEPTVAETAATEHATVGPGVVGTSADGTTENPFTDAAHPVEGEEEENGLYDEPSDTTERPNEDRRVEQLDSVSAMDTTDDADYEEARARTSTSDTDRFEDAESLATALDTKEREKELGSTGAGSKFQEVL